MPAAGLSHALRATLERAIGEAEGEPFRLLEARPVGGGCIARGFRLQGSRRAYFLKLAPGAEEPFSAEADGLAALARCDALRVPRAVARGIEGADAFLVLEWLDLEPQGDDGRLGEAVAALHALAFPRFGWYRDNFIGSTPQENGWDADWARFFAERRLAPQLRLAAGQGAASLARRGETLLARVPELLAGHAPTPSLVHGDLWSGNKGFVDGQPALFDPAVHAGDGETDLAMADLFGGFSPHFHAAYHAVRPLGAGHVRRRTLYQLYHVLNHFNLFGSGYGHQASALIDALLADLG